MDSESRVLLGGKSGRYIVENCIGSPRRPISKQGLCECDMRGIVVVAVETEDWWKSSNNSLVASLLEYSSWFAVAA